MREKLSALESEALVPTKSSVLLSLSLRKFDCKPGFDFFKIVGEGGGWEGRVQLSGKVKLGVIRKAVKQNTIFMENITKWGSPEVKVEG